MRLQLFLLITSFFFLGACAVDISTPPFLHISWTDYSDCPQKHVFEWKNSVRDNALLHGIDFRKTGGFHLRTSVSDVSYHTAQRSSGGMYYALQATAHVWICIQNSDGEVLCDEHIKVESCEHASEILSDYDAIEECVFSQLWYDASQQVVEIVLDVLTDQKGNVCAQKTYRENN